MPSLTRRAASQRLQIRLQRCHDPWTYLKDVLTRLPTQPNSRIEELLPQAGSHRRHNSTALSSRGAMLRATEFRNGDHRVAMTAMVR